MRIKLKEGKQKELIKKFKDNRKLTWTQLSNLLGVKYGKIKSYFEEESLIHFFL